jgi:hypothetical protein
MSAVETIEEPVTLRSPFALMHPDAAREIAERAAALELPSRRCSPLSNPRIGGSPLEAEDGADTELA